MKSKIILVGALIAAATPAFAADLAPAPMEPVAPVYVPYNWSGFYIGADIGYSWTNVDVDYPGTGLSTSSPDANGVVGGIYAGYNPQFNQIVVGIEADIEATNKSGDKTVATILGPLTAKVDDNWQGSVRARLGYAIDNFMPYITGGVAWTDFDTTTSIPGLGSVDSSNTFVGWTIGAGLEYAFTPNIIGRVEYRYTDYGSNDDNLTAFGFDNNVDLKDNTVRIGVAYKF